MDNRSASSLHIVEPTADCVWLLFVVSICLTNLQRRNMSIWYLFLVCKKEMQQLLQLNINVVTRIVGFPILKHSVKHLTYEGKVKSSSLVYN